MEIYGHRGAAGLALENTVSAIQKALELNVDGIEFDVRSTQDSQPIIIHDDTLARTHHVAGNVTELTLAEIRDLLKDHEFPVPTLTQVMQAIGRAVPVNIEIKEVAAVAPALQVLNEMAAAKLIDPNRILITSFDHSAVALFREYTERYKLGLLTSEIPSDAFWDLAKSLDVYSVNIGRKVVNEEFVNLAHQDGRKVMVYTVNDIGTAQKLAKMGVDALFSDVPDRVNPKQKNEE